MIRSEKLCEGNLSTSLLEGFTSSDAAYSQIARTVQVQK